MKKLKLLSIGNSFSCDAHAMLSEICSLNGFDVALYNLYIGGCPLITHWDNVENNTRLYALYINGKHDREISIHEAIKMHEYDIITLQQASIDSGVIETFYPYLTNLIDWVKTAQPKAKIYLHQTWAYESDYTDPRFEIYKSSTEVMFNAITETFKKVSEATCLEIINSGSAIQQLRSYPQFFPNGEIKLTSSDGVHLSGYGQYASALTWYKFLSKTAKLGKIYYPNDLDKKLIDVISEAVYSLGS